MSTMQDSLQPDRVIIRRANDKDREHIYRLRHEVYAVELRQHKIQISGTISDSLDAANHYFIAAVNEVMLGFVSVTPPNPGGFSVDKYLRRADFPELSVEPLFEVRLLTVLSPYRGRDLALMLMYAAFRWIDSQGGKRVIAIGRQEVLPLYLRLGLRSLGRRFQAGEVAYELLTATIDELHEALRKYSAIINRLERSLDWQLGCSFRKPASCFHGGAFFNAIGTDFDQLDRRHLIINADVLDAWYPPSPKVIAALQEDLPWILRTSPPGNGDGLIRAIATARRIPESSVFAGAGSSSLIFLALRHWLTAESRVLILDPTYGEYAHVLEQVIRCRVDRFRLSPEKGFVADLNRLQVVLKRDYDLVVLVNPNSPTGAHIRRSELEELLVRAPTRTRIWIDETYVDYAGPLESLEPIAAGSRNIIICKSMSKVFALSGVRAAYLCGPASLMEELRAITPPWAISLPAQIAAVAALRDPEYYFARYAETHRLREQLAIDLMRVTNWKILPGIANFLLCLLPESGPDANTVVERCRAQGLFLRDVSAMGRRIGKHALRIAVKDAATNFRMIEIIRRACGLAPSSRPGTRVRRSDSLEAPAATVS